GLVARCPPLGFGLQPLYLVLCTLLFLFLFLRFAVLFGPSLRSEILDLRSQRADEQTTKNEAPSTKAKNLIPFATPPADQPSLRDGPGCNMRAAPSASGSE